MCHNMFLAVKTMCHNMFLAEVKANSTSETLKSIDITFVQCYERIQMSLLFRQNNYAQYNSMRYFESIWWETIILGRCPGPGPPLSS